MKYIILLYIFIGCQEIVPEIEALQDRSVDNTPELQQKRVQFGTLYNMNGDDYVASEEPNYASYSQVIKLVNTDDDGFVHYKERLKTEIRFRINTPQKILSTRYFYYKGSNRVMTMSVEAIVTADPDKIKVCRKETIDNRYYEWQCETFFLLE